MLFYTRFTFLRESTDFVMLIKRSSNFE